MSKNVKIALIIGGVILGVIIILPLVLGVVLEWPYSGWGMMAGFGWMWLVPIF